MRKYIMMLAVLALWGIAACGEKKPSAEELDHKEAVRIDSVANDLNASTESLQQQVDETEKAVDDLLKDI
ncbi:MAG TPA: hypothetical protein PLG25_07870 [bacterium]|nr:hypothetical protein [bacterium]HMW33027.1 hypothetical protein [bacterium]HMY37160.1 hypothetical protein [bacterium]HMZ05824.1 hypothetical protein [bacterium]HNB10955.1 hypothetical protein [bacterium]